MDVIIKEKRFEHLDYSLVLALVVSTNRAPCIFAAKWYAVLFLEQHCSHYVRFD